MKLIWYILFLSAAALPLYSQADEEEKFMIDVKKIKHGGMIAPVMKFTQINNEPALMLGGRIAWIINHNFCLGAGAYTMISGNPQATDTTDPVTGLSPTLMVTQVGMEFEYIEKPHKLLHYSIMAHIGAGNLVYALNYMSEDYGNPLDETSNRYSPDYGSDWYFVFEPQAHLILNVSKYVRIALGASYRFARGADYSFSVKSTGKEYHYDTHDVSGPAAIFTIKVGYF